MIEGNFPTTNVFPPLHSVVLLVVSTFLKIKRQDINYGHLCISWNRSFIYVIFVCLRIVVSNTYCVFFMLCFSSSCGPYVASFSGLSFLPLTYFFKLLHYLETVKFNVDMSNNPKHWLLNWWHLRLNRNHNLFRSPVPEGGKP